MITHTPGPWHYHAYENEVWSVEPPVLLAHIYTIEGGYTDEDIAEYTANARLIAAAPDLLAACELAISAMGDLDIDPYEQMPKEHKQILAAIAKATQP